MDHTNGFFLGDTASATVVNDIFGKKQKRFSKYSTEKKHDVLKKLGVPNPMRFVKRLLQGLMGVREKESVREKE